MPSFPYLILLALSSIMGWKEPTVLAFPLAVTMPLAYVIPFLEHRQRNLQKNASSKLITLAEGLGPLSSFPNRLIARSFLQQAGGGLLVFLVVYLSVYCIFSLDHDNGFIPLDVDWSILYAIAAIGALLSLRIKRAYFVFILCMAALLLFR